MKKVQFLILVALAVVFVGCSNPAEGVPEAQVTAPTTNATAAAPVPAGKLFSFSAETAAIDFTGSKVTGSHSGGFTNFVGELTVADGKLASSGHRIVIDTTSLWSDNGRLTNHLKSPDFFGVEKHPSASFVVGKVAYSGTEAQVSGQLTLHGITKMITFPAQISVTDNSVEVMSEFVLNRFDFEMKYPGRADDLIRKEVVIKLKVKASPGKADFSKVPATPPAA